MTSEKLEELTARIDAGPVFGFTRFGNECINAAPLLVAEVRRLRSVLMEVCHDDHNTRPNNGSFMHLEISCGPCRARKALA